MFKLDRRLSLRRAKVVVLELVGYGAHVHDMICIAICYGWVPLLS